jgi:hypothetical protein
MREETTCQEGVPGEPHSEHVFATAKSPSPVLQPSQRYRRLWSRISIHWQRHINTSLCELKQVPVNRNHHPLNPRCEYEGQICKIASEDTSLNCEPKIATPRPKGPAAVIRHLRKKTYDQLGRYSRATSRVPSFHAAAKSCAYRIAGARAGWGREGSE